MEKGTGLAVDPSFAGVRLALASLAAFQLGGGAKPLRDVGIVNEGTTALGILVPIVGPIQQGFAEKSFVAQVGGVVNGLD